MAGRRLGHPAASVAPPNPSVSTASYVPSNTRPMPSLSTDNTNAASPTSDTITFNNKHSAHLPVDGTPNGRGIEGDNNSLIASSVSPSRKANRPGKINPGSPVEHYLDPSSVVKVTLLFMIIICSRCLKVNNRLAQMPFCNSLSILPWSSLMCFCV